MLKAYFQITKPGIILGNLLTTIAGYLFASGVHLKLASFIGILIGTYLVIAAACTFNNLADRKIDRQMERTAKRPSVTGAISLKAGLIYGSFLTIAGIIFLLILTNLLTVLIALVGFIVYVSAYTYSKRKTHLATLIGSISGATPIVGGCTAFSNHLGMAGLIIGLMMVVWQMPHFYAIAIFREKEYAQAKIPVLPITSGHQTTVRQMIFYSGLFLLLALSLYGFAPVGLAYLLVMGIVCLAWFGFNCRGLFLSKLTKWARQDFRYSLIVLLIMSLMLALH